jgi:H+/Cl- antiporter ClcA
MPTSNRPIPSIGRSQTAFKRLMHRTLFLMGGLCVGGAAMLMASLAEPAQMIFHRILELTPYAAFIVTPSIFGFCAFLARKVFPNSQGSGIPQVIAATELHDSEDRSALVSLKIAAGKVIVMMLGLAGGASIGREGPTVQVGASIMAAFGRWAPAGYQVGLLLAGGAAGIAAAFNTPLAGIVFGIEELSQSFEARTSGLIIGCVIAAGITSLAIMGDYAYFGSTAETLPLGRSWLIVPLCGIAGGLAGGLFSRIVIAFSTGLPRAFTKRRPIAFAMACGFCVALCGFASADTVYGTGYAEARSIVHATATLPASFGALKLLSTLFSSISGIPGGLFAPSLAVGAGLGADLHILFQSVPIGALALLGMVAYLTGVVQTPITSFVIVAEMTQNHAMIIPLMATALIANTTSKLVCPESIYRALSQVFLTPAADEAAGDGRPSPSRMAQDPQKQNLGGGS